MKRAYMFAAVIFLVGVAVALSSLLGNQAPIPDSPPASLGIAGRLLVAQQASIAALDLATGELTPVFSAPDNTLITAAALSPDGETIALAYAPPPEGFFQLGYTNLYTLPADGSGGVSIVVDGKGKDVITAPAWSADGRHIIYVRSGPTPDGLTTQLKIEQVDVSGGAPETLAANGFAPAVSPDGSSLAYVATPPGANHDILYLASITGKDPRPLTTGDQLMTIDRPAFSPDGGFIVYSGDQPPFAQQPGASSAPGTDWMAALGGVRTASAHSIATADIWRSPTAGGAPTRLLKLLAQGMVLDYSPDGAHIAFVTTQGLYVMRADGSHPVRISDAKTTMSVAWFPD